METNSLVFVILGIFATGIVGLVYARSIEGSIRKLIRGTEAVRRGNLDYRIEIPDLDEIGKLATAFNQMAIDLKASQESLIRTEKLAALGTMAAGMAHEIKNPLVSLKTFTQILPQKHHDPAFIEKFNAIVPHEIDRINRIAENLLRFGRPSKPEFALGDINEIVQEVYNLLETQCRKSEIRLKIELFNPLSKTLLDAEQLSQALINLVLNAMQAMPKEKEGGEIVVKTGERLHRPSKGGEGGSPTDSETKYLFVSVSDNGKGILPEHVQKLFDPFFTTKRGGTGMGLPITQRIIEDHGGEIDVWSQFGRGTTFTVYLPIREELPKQEHLPPDTDVL